MKDSETSSSSSSEKEQLEPYGSGSLLEDNVEIIKEFISAEDQAEANRIINGSNKISSSSSTVSSGGIITLSPATEVQQQQVPEQLPQSSSSSSEEMQEHLLNRHSHKHNNKAHKRQHGNSSNNGKHNEDDKKQQKATDMTVRCKCNLSRCVTSNYMCKSEKKIYINEDGSTTEVQPGCFVEELNLDERGAHFTGVTESNGRVTSARRGCIEMLPREKLKLCSDRTGAPIHCCFNDEMCNYPKTFYPPRAIPPNHINRISFDSSNGIRGMPPPNLEQQVWLRAALIAVPICGLMILIVLIIVARKLLKNDERYKEARMYSPDNNKSYYSHYYYPPPPPPPPINEYPFIKPVFHPEYRDELLLPQSPQHCYCCHANLNNPHQQIDGNCPGGMLRKISKTSETEGLVDNNCEPDNICQCPYAESATSDYNLSESDQSEECGRSNMIGHVRPPSVVFTGPPIEPLTASNITSDRNKFSGILSKLKVWKKGENDPENSATHV